MQMVRRWCTPVQPATCGPLVCWPTRCLLGTALLLFFTIHVIHAGLLCCIPHAVSQFLLLVDNALCVLTCCLLPVLLLLLLLLLHRVLLVLLCYGNHSSTDMIAPQDQVIGRYIQLQFVVSRPECITLKSGLTAHRSLCSTVHHVSLAVL